MGLEREAGCHAKKFSCRRAHWREERRKAGKPHRRLTARFQVRKDTKALKGIETDLTET